MQDSWLHVCYNSQKKMSNKSPRRKFFLLLSIEKSNRRSRTLNRTRLPSWYCLGPRPPVLAEGQANNSYNTNCCHSLCFPFHQSKYLNIHTFIHYEQYTILCDWLAYCCRCFTRYKELCNNLKQFYDRLCKQRRTVYKYCMQHKSEYNKEQTNIHICNFYWSILKKKKTAAPDNVYKFTKNFRIVTFPSSCYSSRFANISLKSFQPALNSDLQNYSVFFLISQFPGRYWFVMFNEGGRFVVWTVIINC